MGKYSPYALFAIELFELLFIIFTGPLIPSNPLLAFAQLLALLLVGWGAFALQRLSVFSILPELPKNASLVISGPYEIIRHPMYSGILLFALVLVINYTTIFRAIALVVLALTIIYKIHLEEEYLEQKFDEYRGYRNKTKRLIPHLY